MKFQALAEKKYRTLKIIIKKLSIINNSFKKVKNKKITCILASIAKQKKKPDNIEYLIFFSLIDFIKK